MMPYLDRGMHLFSDVSIALHDTGRTYSAASMHRK